MRLDAMIANLVSELKSENIGPFFTKNCRKLAKCPICISVCIFGKGPLDQGALPWPRHPRPSPEFWLRHWVMLLLRANII